VGSRADRPRPVELSGELLAAWGAVFDDIRAAVRMLTRLGIFRQAIPQLRSEAQGAYIALARLVPADQRPALDREHRVFIAWLDDLEAKHQAGSASPAGGRHG